MSNLNLNLNKAVIAGHVGSVETKYTGGGAAVLNLSVATNEQWTDKDGNKNTATEWHRVVVFGKLAELVKDWVKKGSSVYIEGRMRTRKWQDKEGTDRWTTEVVVSGYGATIRTSNDKSNKNASNDAPESQARQEGDNPADKVPEDDIPF